MFSIKNLFKIALVLILLGLIALSALYFSMRADLPSVQSLKDIQWQTPMKIYSADGKLISQFGEKKRIPLTFEEIPQTLIDALLATEDDRFYLHFGVDPIGMGRAVLGQLMGQNKGGASTITMQVARNFFLTREQTYIRKIREIFLSFHIESLLTKDEILTLYINKISLGHRSFGYGAAAQVYYGKNVNELTLAEIAVLAGLPKAPSTYNPISRPERAKHRRSVVLHRMFDAGYITQAQMEQAKSAPITAKKHGANIELSAPYVAEMAHQEMIERYGKDNAYTSGYRVFTTVPSKLQLAAQQAVIKNIFAYDQRHGYRGPIASMIPDPEDVVTTDDSALDDTSIDSNFDTNTASPHNITDDIASDLTPEALITEETMDQALANITSYQGLEPAVVTSIEEKAITVRLKSGDYQTITWQGLSWARPFINDDKQGKAPKSAEEIVSYGDIVMVINSDNGYRLSQLPDVSAALVSLSPDDGAIKAAVGGFSFAQSQFNRVTQAKRQVGSNIKPFIYSAALDNGYTLASIVNDAPINKWDRKSGIVWRPKNSPPVYNGEIRLRLALAQSKNVVAVRLLRDVGLSKIIPYLATFGFDPSDLPRNESLALGSASLTPLEVATGFAAFANGGFLIEPYLIARIEDSFGNILFQADPVIACDDCQQLAINTSDNTAINHDDNIDDVANIIPAITNNNASDLTTDKVSPFETKTIKRAERVISAQNAFLITQALNSAIWGADWNIKPFWQGTGFRARSLKRRDIAGKTGTTNQAKDAWFSGYSRRVVTTSWVGFDDPVRNLGRTTYNPNLGKQQTTGKEFGAKSAQPAWITFMETALSELTNEPFQQPRDIVSVRIDKHSGKLTHKTDKSSRFEYFQLGTAPTDYIKQDVSSEILESDDEIIEEEEDIF